MRLKLGAYYILLLRGANEGIANAFLRMFAGKASLIKSKSSF